MNGPNEQNQDEQSNIDPMDAIIDDAMAEDDVDYDTLSNAPDDNDVDEPSIDNQTEIPEPETHVDENNVAPVPNDTQPQAGTQNQQTPESDPNRQVTTRYDNNGNVVDQNNKIVARSGAEARLYTKASRAESRAETLNAQNEAMSQQMRQAQSTIAEAQRISQIPASLGLNEQQYTEGLQMMQRFQQNPIDVAKEVVAMAMAQGYNATDILGNDAGNAIEMSAVHRMVADSTAPLREQQQREQQAQNARREAETRYNNFVAQHPDALTHQEDIAMLMTHRNMDATNAYYAVREFALRNNLDLSQPLRPQMQAKQQQGNGNGQRGNPQRAPMAQGGVTHQQQPLAQSGIPSSDMSYKDIVRSAMQSPQ